MAEGAIGTVISEGGVDMAEITGFGDMGPEREMIDITTLAAPGNFDEWIPSLRRGGEMSLDMNFSNSTFQQFLTTTGTSIKYDYKITFPSGSYAEFSGYPKKYKISAEAAGKIAASASIQITGEITFTAI